MSIHSTLLFIFINKTTLDTFRNISQSGSAQVALDFVSSKLSISIPVFKKIRWHLIFSTGNALICLIRPQTTYFCQAECLPLLKNSIMLVCLSVEAFLCASVPALETSTLGVVMGTGHRGQTAVFHPWFHVQSQRANFVNHSGCSQSIRLVFVMGRQFQVEQQYKQHLYIHQRFVLAFLKVKPILAPTAVLSW